MNEAKKYVINLLKFTFQYVSILMITITGNPFICEIFTFQYVSILMDDVGTELNDLIPFTFQYVSILINAISHALLVA